MDEGAAGWSVLKVISCSLAEPQSGRTQISTQNCLTSELFSLWAKKSAILRKRSSFGGCAKLFDRHISNVSRNKEATYIVQVGDVAFRIREGDIFSLICHDHDS